jgi:hypothetical protein
MGYRAITFELGILDFPIGHYSIVSIFHYSTDVC